MHGKEAECPTAGPNHADAWREWLRLSNALSLRDWPTTITTMTLTAEPATAPAQPSEPATVEPDIVPVWQPVIADAAAGFERDFLVGLAAAGVLPPPEIGTEGPDGIPLDVSWPALRIAVAMPGMTTEDRDDLTAAGWRVIAPETAAVITALADIGAEGNA